MKQLKFISAALFILFIIGCSDAPKKEDTAKKFTDQELENIVRHAYQYVAMYNVVNNFAMKDDNLFYTHGWNNTYFGTKLSDHTAKAIARPNNDTYYIISTLDLRDDAVVINYPAFNSKYVSLEVSGYDHYVTVPLATSKGDFKKPVKVLYYSDRTKNYHGEAVEGVDTVLKMTSDFVVAFLRLAPHVNDKERSAAIKKALDDYKVTTLSEFLGKKPVQPSPVEFPPYGTDQYVFKNDFLQVMQFVFNHVSFDTTDAMDKEVLAIFAPLGVIPGQEYDSTKVVKIDGDRLARIAEKVAKESLAIWNSPDNPYIYKVFQPKGQMTLDAMVIQSAVGPIGLPASQALYPGVGTKSGEPLNSQNDYVIHMTKDELPPAKAFWSFTLYDAQNGYFIPNDRKKYTVGENGGMKLNDDGGIDVYIAAGKPEGVPEENWLPINRDSINLDIILRIYAPDTAKIKNWKAPKAEKIK
jgi:hypothetical protein